MFFTLAGAAVFTLIKAVVTIAIPISQRAEAINFLKLNLPN